MTTDWETWYNETLDELVAVLESTPDVDWGTDANGDPWVVVGDRVSTGVNWPACFIPQFTKTLDQQESDRRSELHDIEALIWIVDQGDVKAQEAKLRDAINLGARVENHLYDNRSLNGTCRRIDSTQMTPASAVVEGESLRTVEIQLGIIKDADH